VRHFRKSNYRILTPPRQAIWAIAGLPVFDASQNHADFQEILAKTESWRRETPASETGSSICLRGGKNGGVENR
jgi:hypothetical protein